MNSTKQIVHVGCQYSKAYLKQPLKKDKTSVVPRSRFLGDTGVPLNEFQGDIYKFWRTCQNLSKFYLLNWIHVVVWKFICSFLFKFELNVDSFGSRRDVDDSEVVSAIALVLNSPANLLFSAFYIKIAFSGLLLWNSGFPPLLLCIGLVVKSISNATFIKGKFHVPV